jgi:hypothetical protein
MNATSVRPQTKFAAAVVAAGVVSAASIVGLPEHRALPVISTDVANASVITDALYGLGDAVNGVASGLAWAFDGAFSLPFDAATVFAIATQAPSVSPSLLSWFLQRYVNPSDDYAYWSYPWAIKVDSIEPLAAMLPLLGPSIINGVNLIADAINSGLAGLPDPTSGAFATDAFWDSDIGRVVLAANFAVTTPVWMLYNTAYYLGYLPADLEATFESALRNPSQIPGLVSNLVYGLLSPTDGLFGDLLGNVSLPFRTLPGPLGELADSIVAAISDSVEAVLSVLPAPIPPTPFPSAAAFEVNSLPDASLMVADGVALSGADLVEKKVEATDSTTDTTVPPATPEEPTPAAGEIDPDADPAADAPEADAPATDPVKSGNKVSPGDKFDKPAKTEPATDDTAAVSAPEGAAAEDPAEPTGPQGAEPDAPDNADGSSNESGAAA